MSLEKVGFFFASREGRTLSRKEGLDLNLRKGQSNRWTLSRWVQSFLGWACQSVSQSSRCLVGAARERWERRVSGVPCVSRHLWHTYVSGTWLLRILAQDRWIQVLHLLHSIMARPANGFMQKHVTRSHESSSEKTSHCE